jgi:hypothetical protein
MVGISGSESMRWPVEIASGFILPSPTTDRDQALDVDASGNLP